MSRGTGTGEAGGAIAPPKLLDSSTQPFVQPPNLLPVQVKQPLKLLVRSGGPECLPLYIRGRSFKLHPLLHRHTFSLLISTLRRKRNVSTVQNQHRQMNAKERDVSRFSNRISIGKYLSFFNDFFNNKKCKENMLIPVSLVDLLTQGHPFLNIDSRPRHQAYQTPM